jgi:hypothetical protein
MILSTLGSHVALLHCTPRFFCSDRVHCGDERTKLGSLSQSMTLVALEAMRQASRYCAFSTPTVQWCTVSGHLRPDAEAI